MEIITIKDKCAVGPYSKAVIAGSFIFVSGQLPINPDTGMMPASIVDQTQQCLDNIHQALIQAGSSLKNVVKATVYLKDMNDFCAMNKVYGQTFQENQPARCALEVSRLPKDALVEIEVVAVK